MQKLLTHTLWFPAIYVNSINIGPENSQNSEKSQHITRSALAVRYLQSDRAQSDVSRKPECSLQSGQANFREIPGRTGFFRTLIGGCRPAGTSRWTRDPGASGARAQPARKFPSAPQVIKMKRARRFYWVLEIVVWKQVWYNFTFVADTEYPKIGAHKIYVHGKKSLPI